MSNERGGTPHLDWAIRWWKWTVFVARGIACWSVHLWVWLLSIVAGCAKDENQHLQKKWVQNLFKPTSVALLPVLLFIGYSLPCLKRFYSRLGEREKVFSKGQLWQRQRWDESKALQWLDDRYIDWPSRYWVSKQLYVWAAVFASTVVVETIFVVFTFMY